MRQLQMDWAITDRCLGGFCAPCPYAPHRALGKSRARVLLLCATIAPASYARLRFPLATAPDCQRLGVGRGRYGMASCSTVLPLTIARGQPECKPQVK